jgi:hypothetical protein
MLDKEHVDLPNLLNDHDAYILGYVDRQNVVIARLLEGKIGTNAAVIIAT